MDTLPNRKPNRIAGYDYSTPRAYFITVCTHNRRNLLWANVGAIIDRPENVPLSHYGRMVDQSIRNIPAHYENVTVDRYVIMPNHIHLLLQIQADGSGRSVSAPTLSTIIRHMKGAATRLAGFPLWQKGYYDHVIRGRQDYADTWNYIDGNPSRWKEDNLYAR